MKRAFAILMALVIVLSAVPVLAFAAEDGLVLHYAMSGANLTDSAGNYGGTLQGNTAWVPGINGYAVKVSGDEDYISVPTGALDQSGDVTVSMWVRPDQIANWTTLLTVGSGTNNYAVFAAQGTPSGNAVGITMAIKVNGGTEYRVAAPSGTSPAAGEWTLVTYTQSGETATLYLNGTQVAQQTAMSSTIKGVVDASASTQIRIGDNHVFNDPSLVGAVSEVKIYSRALSASEVKAQADAGSESAAKLELQAAADKLDLGDLSEVYSDIQLVTAIDGVQVTWASSNEAFVTSGGKVTLPTESQGEQAVTLTATLSSPKTSAVITKQFKFTLTPLTDGIRAKKAGEYVQRYVEYILNDGYELLTGGKLDEVFGTDYHCDIQWTVTSGNAEIVDGKLYKTKNAAEREPIKLTAAITVGSAQETVTLNNITLMDEYVAYILSFFGGDDGAQKLHLAYSYDGINWKKLNDGLTVLPTTVGNGNVRDPFIFRKKDGSFGVVATQGWDTSQIYFWDSEDLVNYSNERLKTVTKSGIAGLTGARAWAPEASYDPIADQYMVYWSDPYANGNNGSIYANTSADLETFSDPFVLFDAGYQIIDANIVKWQGTYYMLFKDERGNNSDGGGGKHILMAKADSIAAGEFAQYTGAITEAPVEGPFMFKVIGEEKWYHYYDYFNEHKFGLSVSTDLASGQWEFLGKSETMPTEDVRHGGVIPVTQKEMNRILVGYGLEDEVISDPGDVNGNGKINVVDIIALKKLILNGSPTAKDLAVADLNGDRVLDASDILSLKALILNGV